MKLFTAILSLALLSAIVGCGDEGIGFNIGKEVPIDVPVDLPVGDPRLIGLGLDPPPVSFTETYDLSEVASDSDLENLDEVLVNGVAYEISGVSTAEQVGLDEFSLVFSSPSGTLGSISLTTPTLQDVAKTDANFDYTALTNALANKETITSEIVVDFATVPAEDILFDFTFYFDVIVKIRE